MDKNCQKQELVIYVRHASPTYQRGERIMNGLRLNREGSYPSRSLDDDWDG